MMCAFVEVYDMGALFTPPDATVRVLAEKSDWPGSVLTVGDKGVGKCEFAPLMGQKTVYTFQMYQGLEPVSDVARCDLGLPFTAPKEGQYHKSFFVRFRYGAVEPPEPPEPPDPRSAELEDALRAVATGLADLLDTIAEVLGE
jgi:hypothetical protein